MNLIPPEVLAALFRELQTKLPIRTGQIVVELNVCDGVVKSAYVSVGRMPQ